MFDVLTAVNLLLPHHVYINLTSELETLTWDRYHLTGVGELVKPAQVDGSQRGKIGKVLYPKKDSHVLWLPS